LQYVLVSFASCESCVIHDSSIRVADAASDAHLHHKVNHLISSGAHAADLELSSDVVS